ncbi:MAG: ComF family protein [Elusimicrobia bacterium]|nr:ComF family protein [Elusimicrobiota bacterium]
MIRILLNFIYPPYCGGCGKLLPLTTKSLVCDECRNFILSCAPQISFNRNLKVITCTKYEGIAKNLVVELKFKGIKSLGRDIAKFMIFAFEKFLKGDNFDVIVPVPLHKKRMDERGFNQAEILAREISRATKIPMKKHILKRTKNTPSQRDFDKKGRFENVKNAFFSKSVNGKKVILVDDVFTTGATISSCEKTLREKGAKEVVALVFARA